MHTYWPWVLCSLLGCLQNWGTFWLIIGMARTLRFRMVSVVFKEWKWWFGVEATVQSMLCRWPDGTLSFMQPLTYPANIHRLLLWASDTTLRQHRPSSVFNHTMEGILNIIYSNQNSCHLPPHILALLPVFSILVNSSSIHLIIHCRIPRTVSGTQQIFVEVIMSDWTNEWYRNEQSHHTNKYRLKTFPFFFRHLPKSQGACRKTGQT